MSAITENNIDPFTDPVCNYCKNHVNGSKCKAFDYIPDIIFTGVSKHKKPLPNQGNTVVFEPRK